MRQQLNENDLISILINFNCLSYHIRSVEDIDLFVGGLAENKAFGSILGPTFGCLNGIQFFHWKYGDRFYFEHGHEAGSFTLGMCLTDFASC